jgi:phage head maturation protease
MTFETTTSTVFAVDAEARTIRGLVVPFGKVGTNAAGKFVFDADTAFSWPDDVTRVKLTGGAHDYARSVGYATSLDKTDDGVVGTFKVARGADGDRALAMAQDKVWDGLSMGLGAGAQFTTRDDVNRGVTAPIAHVALVPAPAFDDARVTSVAASAVPDNTAQKGSAMPDENKPTEGTPTPAPSTGPVDFAAIEKAVGDPSAAQAFAALVAALPQRETSPAAGEGTGASVGAEPLPYRFDGRPSEHDFSTDMFAAIRFKDGEAKQRLDEFMAAQFAATDSGDVGALAPATYRPDLYVDQQVARTPVYDALNKGPLNNITPFVVPKFGSASDLVGDHTEGEEPDDGTFTATSQTVTPTAVSGQARIVREVVDAGGSPQVSALIWTQIQRAYAASLEAKSATLLTGSAATELGTVIAAGTADSDLAEAVLQKLALLPFIDGGEDFTGFLGHAELYAALAAAKDDNGRPIFPQLAPQNANGTTAARFASIAVGGWNLTPAKSLGAVGTGQKSYLFDPLFGGVWASGAQRIALPDTVATTANVGVFGYVGTAVLDVNRVRKITYDATA